MDVRRSGAPGAQPDLSKSAAVPTALVEHFRRLHHCVHFHRVLQDAGYGRSDDAAAVFVDRVLAQLEAQSGRIFQVKHTVLDARRVGEQLGL